MGSLKQSNPSAPETLQKEASELDTLKDKYKRLQQEEIGVLEERLKIKPQVEEARTATTLLSTLPEVTLRREFQICGKIGEAYQKDKLSDTSLINQIESGQHKGHSEAVIIEAVKRAVHQAFI